MTKAEAHSKAATRASKFGGCWLVLKRTDHPLHPHSVVYFAVRKSEVHTLSPGTTIEKEYQNDQV